MKSLVIFLVVTGYLLTGFPAIAQSQSTWVIDFVTIKNGLRKEAMFYYENNWKSARDRMLAQKFIKSYQILSVKPDSLTQPGLVLMTEFADSISYQKSEARFEAVFNELRPDGSLKLLNEKKPNEFRQLTTNRTGRTIVKAGIP